MVIESIRKLYPLLCELEVCREYKDFFCLVTEEIDFIPDDLHEKKELFSQKYFNYLKSNKSEILAYYDVELENIARKILNLLKRQKKN